MNLDSRRFRFTLATLFFFTSILLKNSSCHFLRQRFFEAKADAKIKRFLVYFQIFFEVFSNFFFGRPV